MNKHIWDNEQEDGRAVGIPEPKPEPDEDEELIEAQKGNY